MSFVRRWPAALCLVLLLGWIGAAVCPTQAAAAQAAAQATPALNHPAEQAYTLPPDKLAKAITISRIFSVLDIVAGLWGIVFVGLLLGTRAAAGLEGWVRGLFTHGWLQGLVFFAALLTLLAAANLPVDMYGHHVSVEYGISIQGWLSWLWEQGKALGLTLLVGAPLLLLFNWFVRRWPRGFWFGIWLVMLPLMVVSLFVAPLLEPLFNDYEPLTQNHSALVDKLELVVSRTGTHIPPQRMFLMKASEKTNGLNAYVNGIGATKRIVVWDTTAGRIPDDEIMFIFGHESGHYVLNHIPKMMAIFAVGAFFVFWIFAGLAGWMARRFGSSWRLQAQDPEAPALATRAGFVVLVFAITIAGFVLEPVANTISRHFEHQADVFGQEAIHTLVPDPQKTSVAAFDKLGEVYLEDPDPNPLIEFWEYNHPSVKTRANFAAHYDPWANGGHGEFFDK
jgi:STE24 endopeptidase